MDVVVKVAATVVAAVLEDAAGFVEAAAEYAFAVAVAGSAVAGSAEAGSAEAEWYDLGNPYTSTCLA